MAGTMENKVVLITGGRRGLGKTMAEYMLREGAYVWITSRSFPKESSASVESEAIQDKNEQMEIKGKESELWNDHPRLRQVYMDVTDENSVRYAFQEVEEVHGRLDVLVNNAGVGIFKPLEETTLTEWQQVLQTNVTGVFLCSREAVRLMKRQGSMGRGAAVDGEIAPTKISLTEEDEAETRSQGLAGGRIINIGSVSGYIPIPENGVYGASKYAVRGLSYILNEEGKGHNIRVSIVNPGAVYTDIWQGREGFDPEDMLQPEDIAATILDIAQRPLHVRIDEVNILPPKGVL